MEKSRALRAQVMSHAAVVEDLHLTVSERDNLEVSTFRPQACHSIPPFITAAHQTKGLWIVPTKVEVESCNGTSWCPPLPCR